MRTLAPIVLFALALCAAQAQAAEPATPSTEQPGGATPTEAAATPATENPAITGAVPKPASKPASAAPAATDPPGQAKAGDAKAEFEIPRGYKVAKRDGETVYCRNEDVIGSRFTSKVCYNQQELKDVEERRKIASDELTRRARVCSSAAACASN